MSRVFLFEPTKFDISSASKYGDIITLFPEHKHRPSIWETEELGSAIVEELHRYKFNCYDDMLLAVGQQIPLLLTLHAITSAFEQTKVLFFHTQVRDYVLRVLKNDATRSQETIPYGPRRIPGVNPAVGEDPTRTAFKP